MKKTKYFICDLIIQDSVHQETKNINFYILKIVQNKNKILVLKIEVIL